MHAARVFNLAAALTFRAPGFICDYTMVLVDNDHGSSTYLGFFFLSHTFHVSVLGWATMTVANSIPVFRTNASFLTKLTSKIPQKISIQQTDLRVCPCEYLLLLLD